MSIEKKAKLQNNLLMYGKALDYLESRVLVMEQFAEVTKNAGDLFLQHCLIQEDKRYDRESIVITGEDFVTCLDLLEKQLFAVQKFNPDNEKDVEIRTIFNQYIKQQVKESDYKKFLNMCNIEAMLREIRKKNVRLENKLKLEFLVTLECR